MDPTYGCSGYPCYVYDNNPSIKSFVNAYVSKLNAAISGAFATGRLIYHEEVYSLKDTYDWIWNTSYWTGSVNNYQSSRKVELTTGHGYTADMKWDNGSAFGVRPVIEISTSVIH